MATLDQFCDSVPESESPYDPDLEAQYDTDAHVLNSARKRVVKESDLTIAEKKRLYAFDRGLQELNNLENRHSPRTRALYIDNTRILQRGSGLLLDTVDVSEDGEEALKKLLKWVQDQGWANNYIHNMLITIQTFGEVMGRDSIQDRFNEITPGSFRDDAQTPLPGNVVEWSEVVQMAQTRDSIRDKAMICSQWGLGTRPQSEFLFLQYKHLDWQGDHYRVTIPWDGKTGERTVRLFPGSALLRYWVEHEHPVHHDPEASLGAETFIWTKLNRNQRHEYHNMNRIFKEAGDDADVGKDTNGQHLRRSRASYMAARPSVSEAELRWFFGWSFQSNSPKHYVAKFREDVARNIAMADGASVEGFEEQGKIAPLECPHCGQHTERHMETCIRCSAHIDEDHHEVTTVVDLHSDQDLVDMITSGEVTADDLRSAKKLHGPIQTRPGFFDDIDDLIQLAEGYEDDSSTSMVTGPLGLGAAASKLVGRVAQLKHTAMSLHPAMEHYPPRGKRLAKLVTTEALLLVGFVAWAWYWGALDRLAAGNPVEVIALLIGLPIGLWTMFQAMPNVDDAAEERFGSD